jgi:hypothetical protein
MEGIDWELALTLMRDCRGKSSGRPLAVLIDFPSFDNRGRIPHAQRGLMK